MNRVNHRPEHTWVTYARLTPEGAQDCDENGVADCTEGIAADEPGLCPTL